MLDPLMILTKLFADAKGTYIQRAAGKVRLQALDYRSWTDEKLKSECENLLSGRHSETAPRPSRLSRLINMLLWHRSDLPDLTGLALGVEAFRRKPADLSEGSQLHPEQVEAAVALTQSSAIQMDTGEGKTYAVLPAALALASRHPHVYIVCANDYLASRDANRTLPFWDYVGLSVDLAAGEHGTFDEAWSRQIVYTTLDKIMFKILEDQSAYDEPRHPLTTTAAVLVDEADAVLIDSAFHYYQNVTHISVSAYDWSRALGLAQALDEKEHVLLDFVSLQATLTVNGEAFLRSRLRSDEIEGAKYLMLRQAVELAFIASRVVKQDVHYVQQDRSLFVVDSTGRINRGYFPNWLTPLAFLKGLPPRPPSVPLDRIWPTNVLPEFAHLAGMSGTVREDLLDYALSYGLMTHVIKPRYPKTIQCEPDSTFLRAEYARLALASQASAAVSAGRPVLITTQTISDAEAMHSLIRQQNQDGVTPHLLTGKNESKAATFFERAGEAGRITIATQLAGRGVDIRLTQEARNKGGMALLALGHSLTARHDRQLLGRVGRQGDPFEARFFNSFDDPFFSRFPSFEKPLRKIGAKDDEAIEHPWISRSIRSAQSRLARQEFFGRRHASQLSATNKEARARFLGWFDAVRSTDDDPAECAQHFLDGLLEHFSENVIQPIFGKETVTPGLAHAALGQIAEALELQDDHSNWLRADDLVGHEDAALAVRRVLSAELGRVFGEARRRREDARQEQAQLWEALVEAWAPTPSTDGAPAPFWREEARALLPAPIEADLEQNDAGADHGDAAGMDSAEEDGSTELALPSAPLAASVDLLGSEANGGDAPSPDVSDRDRSTSSAFSAASQRLEALERRCPRCIAHAVLQQIWAAHIETLDRLDFEVGQGRHPPINRYRLLRERAHLAQREMETQVSRRLLVALLRADIPESLDDLFFLREKAVTVDQPASNGPLPLGLSRSSRGEETARNRGDQPAKRDEVIRLFLRQQGERLASASLSEDRLSYLFREFLDKHPFASLYRPDMILQALDAWSRSARDAGIKREERQPREKALRAFLVYLRERRLIGPLPRLQDRAVATGRRLLANLSGVRVMLPLLGIAVFAAIFVALSHVSVGASYGELGGLAALTDDLLFGGALRSGAVSGLVIGALAAACLAAGLLQPHVDLADQMNGFGKLGFWFLLPLIVVGAYLSSSTGDDVLLAFLKAGLAASLVLGLGAIMRASLVAIWADTGLTALSFWLTYTSLGVLALNLAGLSGSYWLFLACFAAGASLTLLWRVVSRAELSVLSRRATGRDMAGEEIRTSVEVSGDVGAAPHALGVVAAWWTVSASPTFFLEAPEWQPLLVAFGVYLVVAAALIHHQLRRRLEPEHWHARLNEMRQVFVDQQWGGSLEGALPRVRARLYRRECLLLVLLSICFAGSSALSVGTTAAARVQIGLFGLLGAVVCATHGARLAAELYRFVSNQGTVMPVRFEEAKLPSVGSDEGLLERLKRFIEHRFLVVALAFITLVKGFFELLDAIKWVVEKWHGG